MLGDKPLEASSTDPSMFLARHIGLTPTDQDQCLAALGHSDLDEFIAAVVPADILEENASKASFPEGCSELEALEEIHRIAETNKPQRSLIGLGYYGTATPAAIQRHVLENPGWYTAYTPYQAEISQGRLEALFNFQTLISELTGLPIANASLLDEATAAAEAMSLAFAVNKIATARRFLVDREVFPQTLAVLSTRAEPLGIVVEVIDPDFCEFDEDVFGVLLQLPGRTGKIWDPSECISRAHKVDALVAVAIDPLAQVLMAPVGELDVDIAIGSVQRLGIPMGFGGPHAAFFATREAYKRQIPGRLVGQSLDSDGKPALRLALQTREQHIRRDKATSNICTAQVLLAIISSFYAVHHGPNGLKEIALRVLSFRFQIERCLTHLGYHLDSMVRFDTVEIHCKNAAQIHHLASLKGLNLRVLPIGYLPNQAKGFGITVDELTTEEEVIKLNQILADALQKPTDPINKILPGLDKLLSEIPLRKGLWLQQPVFNRYQSETELVRYIYKLVSKDFSLIHGMIPLGSCTMKLNSAAELVPISWRNFSSVHPFAPSNQSEGYKKLVLDLETWLASLTGFAGVSLQPNAGSQGEFAGLLVIRAWHKSRGEGFRNVCLIPTSAHGTNPASAVMAGFRVVPVACDPFGNVDLQDLANKAETYSSQLAALMVTYPSTHGVFEPHIRQICELVHKHGAQVYLDGANLNAQVGLCRPGTYGADVCHLNLHKTFCIPHGGGGPGVGPIAVAAHLVPYLPGHPLVSCGGKEAIGAVSAAPFGSAGILPISWMYLRMMGVDGLRQASSIAMLSANYIAYRLDPFYPVLFKGLQGRIAHECILDLRPLKQQTGIEVDDVAKRLMDYGFHAPTVSWPVAGTLMVEPTESESFEELNRFCDAMISIRSEIEKIELGQSDVLENPLKCAPHTLQAVTTEVWERPYTRSDAAFPLPDQRENKFWPAVSRINNVFGDRNLICTCTSFEDLIDQ